MNLLKDKRGAELSMNVVIIAILVVIVLVIVAFFFTGGFAKISETIRGIFNPSIPDDLQIAQQTCSQNCELAQAYEQDSLKQTSNYCKKTYKLDADGDGKADSDSEGNLRKYHCWEAPASQICPGVYNLCPEA